MPPINLLIKPASSLCNMRCHYCFYADVSQKRESRSYGLMSLETLEQTVRRAFEYADGWAGFAFQGGEPTLAGLPFFEALLTYQDKYNIKKIPVHNAIQTNGYLINDDWAKFFAEHNFLVGLSMDGTRDAHDALRIDAEQRGTFDRVTKAAHTLSRHNVDFNILCVINNFVARYPQKVYNQLKQYRYIQFIACMDGFESQQTTFSLTPMRYTNFLCRTFELYYQDFMHGNYVSIRNFDNYIRILMGYPPENCAMNGQCTCYGVIEGDGSVFPCDFYVLDEWKLGNIWNDSLEAMLDSPRAHAFINPSLSVSPECQNCPHATLCRGGCRREREPFIAGHPSLNRFCDSYRKFFDSELPKMFEIARILQCQRIGRN